MIAAVGSISTAINDQCIASLTIAQGVEQIPKPPLGRASHDGVGIGAMRDRTARLDQTLARFRVA